MCDFKRKKSYLALIEHHIDQLESQVAALKSRKAVLIATKQNTAHVEEMLFFVLSSLIIIRILKKDFPAEGVVHSPACFCTEHSSL